MNLEAFFQKYSEVAIAFSGGVDSAFLLYAASLYSKRVSAYYVKTEFQPQFELNDAIRLAESLAIPLSVLSLSQLEDPLICANGSDRCYHCKKRILNAISSAAAKDGFSVLLDGTNADDNEEDRPGFRALRECNVLSPLRLCGMTKAEIRTRSRLSGLFTHDKPAYACLATRVPSGECITLSKLRSTEEAESFLFAFGFQDFRIRCIDGRAVIQIRQEQFPLFEAHKECILTRLAALYDSVQPTPEVRI